MDPEIGDVSEFSNIQLELDEILGKLDKLIKGTTCSTIDTIRDLIRQAHVKFEDYFEWAEKIEEKQEELLIRCETCGDRIAKGEPCSCEEWV